MVKSEAAPAENLPRPEVEEQAGGARPEQTGNDDGGDVVKKIDETEKKEETDKALTTMHLTSADKMATNTSASTTVTPPTTSGGPQNLHHSPGSASTSSSSSSSSSNTGYTRQSNPRPRSHKHSTGSATGTTTAPPIISSLPPSALTAAPYIPTSMLHQQQQPATVVDYHHGGHNHPPPLHHIHHLHHPVHVAPSYAYMPGTVQSCPDGGPPHAAGVPPPGIPPPPLNPPNGPVLYNPYYPPMYDGSATGIPTFIHHVTPPTPSGTNNTNSNANNTSGKSGGGNRMSPAPHPLHLVHPPVSSGISYCQNHSPSAAVSSTASPVSSCQSNSAGMQPQQHPQQHVVSYHLQQGEVISLQLGDGQVEVIQGPATIRMVSTNSTPPLPLPMQVPPGHMVQQIIDQNGTLQHVILSPDPLVSHGHPQGPPPPPGSTPFVPALNPYTSSPSNGSPAAAPPPLGPNPIPASNNSTTYVAVSSAGSVPTTRQPFPNTQYGPPPGAPILQSTPSTAATATTGSGSGSHTPTPSSHGPSPTPSSGSGCGSSPWIPSSTSHPPGYPMGDRRVRDATHERLIKKTARRQQQQHPAVTPPVSPAKRGGRENVNFRSSGSSSSGSTSGLGTNSVGSTSGKNNVGPNPAKSDSRQQHDDSEESGVGHEEEEEMQQLLIELLSNIKTPKVSEIEARSALLKWGPPVREPADPKFEALEHILDVTFRYEVLLSDKGKDGSYRSIFTGHSIECRLTDLRPCTEYHIRIHALYDTLKGGASDTVSFETESCEPDKPMPPKMISRSKTSINLRWNSPLDNGAHIQQYILEYDEGKGKYQQQPMYPVDGEQGYIHDYYNRVPQDDQDKVFVPVFKGRAKSFNLTKLKTSAFYRFRLIAVNELGRSQPSEVVTFATQGSAPPQPQPPGLKEATKSSLHLVWTKRPSDAEFVLHMDDQISGHGFLPVYTGADLQHISTGLRRNAAYKFRLQSQNEEGKSPWSDDVAFFTLPDVPGPPLRPASKGRIHPHSFKVRWDPPHDDGGSAIENYILEVDGGHGWQTFYQGSDTECICEHLFPGTQYKVRVACTSAGGVSNYSDVCHICTEPVCPGQCAPPRPHGKPKATSIHLKWGWPESDGGSPVSEFEIDMTTPDNKTLAVYRGRETECIVASLLPGRPYLFQVRAHNRVGFGPWSDSLEVVSGAGAPDQPQAPRVSCRSPTSVRIEWDSPINNGALIIEYMVEMALIASRKCLSPPPPPVVHHLEDRSDSADEDEDESSSSSGSSRTSSDSEDEQDVRVGEDDDEEDDVESQDSDDEDEEGSHSRHKPLATQKRKKKSKSRRRSNEDVWEESEAASNDEADNLVRRGKNKKSAAVSGGRHKANKVVVPEPEPEVAQQPEVNKVPEFVQIYCGSARAYDARNLDPATTYLFRVCAVNSAGPSEWSPNREVTTMAAPPAVVTNLQLRLATANALSLIWNRPISNGENITHYNVDTGSAVIPTSGPEAHYTLEGLRPDTAYTVRVQAVNCIGPGPFCPGSRFHTRPLPPAPPKCECVNANYNCLKLKWGDGLKHANGELCHYTLEMENSRNQFQSIYNGTGVSHKVSKLVENRVYRFRICASNEAGQGPYSPMYEFKTDYAHPPPIKAAPRVSGITEDGCLVEWSAVKLAPLQGGLHFKVQLTKVKDNETKIIYTGNDTQFRVSGLDARTEYAVRVSCVRVPEPGKEKDGIFSPPGIFSTSVGESGTGGSTSGKDNKTITTSKLGLFPNKNDKTWTDNQWAFVILVGFTAFALCVAVIIQQIIAWGIIPS